MVETVGCQLDCDIPIGDERERSFSPSPPFAGRVDSVRIVSSPAVTWFWPDCSAAEAEQQRLGTPVLAFAGRRGSTVDHVHAVHQIREHCALRRGNMKYILVLLVLSATAMAQPTITAVLDGGSYTNNIAQGSVFVIKGTGLSAAGYVAATAPIYPDALNTVSITLTAVNAET